jgi:hypothetical protein
VSSSFLLIAGLICAFNFVSAARRLVRSRATERFSRTTGTIGESSVEPGGVLGKRNYIPHLRYTYSVGGQTFHGTELSYARRQRLTFASAQRAMEPFPVDREVPVHYDPHNPQISVLEAGVRPRLYLELIGSVVGFAGFCAFAYFT